MPIRRSPNGVLNAVHRLGRLPGTVGLHPVGTVGRHASERQVVMTWCAHTRFGTANYLVNVLGRAHKAARSDDLQKGSCEFDIQGVAPALYVALLLH